MTSPRNVLIATIQPAGGGVPAMVKAVIDYLRQRDYTVTLAYYEPYSVSPECSVPLHCLFSRKPSSKFSEYYEAPCVGIGSYLPELEFTHYKPSDQWRELIERHDVHLTVSGSCLAALPFVQSATPFMAWIASDWHGDREHRVKTFPWYRRLVDQTIIRFMTQRLERKIIGSNNLVALSEHTQTALNQKVQYDAVADVLPMPIDTDYFAPNPRLKPEASDGYRIGFFGRFEDPRKNIGLLVRSFATLVKTIPQLELVLIGDRLSDHTIGLAEQLGVLDKIIVHPYISGDKLLESIHSLDVFILPSYQEGLCIAALEAMSCGVPVVSTRCGGPESYVAHGENGLLVKSDPEAMSKAILQLLSDDDLRLRYAENARKTIIQRFSKQALATVFWALFDKHFDQSED